MEMMYFFIVLIYINLFTIGGGYAMIPLLHSEIVVNHHWLTEKEFLESIAVGQLTPGPLTIMNIFIGFKVFSYPGALGALFCTYVPPFIVTGLVAKYYKNINNSPPVLSAMRAIRPAVIGLIASAGISLTMTSFSDFPMMMIALTGFILLIFTKIDPSWVILGSGIVGALLL